MIFTPGDVDLARSPLRRGIAEPTYVLGAFNPGFTRLANGNLLLMVRVAEAVREPVQGQSVRAIRWTPDGYVLDAYDLAAVDMIDPRQFAVRHATHRMLALTSLSWPLPVELAADGAEIVAVEGYLPAEQDFRSTLVRVREAKPDAVVLQSYYSDAALIARHIRYGGLTAALVANGAIYSPKFL